MSKPILIHITQPPTPNCEALEYALAMAAFDLDVSILFSGRGVYWLKPSQQARITGGKNPQKLLAALPMYGIENIYFDPTPGIEASSGLAEPLSGLGAKSDFMNNAQVVNF